MDQELKRIEVKDGSAYSDKWRHFRNGEVLVIVLGLMGSGLMLSLSNLGFPPVLVFVLTILPFLLSVLYVSFFMYKKPPHYTGDFVEGLGNGNQFQPFSKAYSRCPDGMFGKNMLIWNDLSKAGIWTCGMELDVPAYDYSKNEYKNYYMDRLTVILNNLAKDNIRINLYWNVSSNYTAELQQYRDATDSMADGKCKEYRTLRYQQYKRLAMERQLRRERLLVFVSRPLNPGEAIHWNCSAKDYDESSKRLLAELENLSLNMFRRFRALFEPCEINCIPLSADQIYQVLRQHFNPSQSLAPQLFHDLAIHPDLSIKEQVICSDLIPAPGCSFLLDGRYYNVYVLKSKLPRSVYFGIIKELTDLYGVQDYEITVNVIPRDVRKLLEKEEFQAKKLQKKTEQKNADISLQFELADQAELIGELHSERHMPLEVQYFIVVNASSVAELDIKHNSIAGAIGRIGIDYYRLQYPQSAINAFFQATPGWMYGGRPKHCFKTLDKYLAPLLPISSTYTGCLNYAEALYLGEQHNLVGVKQFARDIRQDSDPQHCIIFGKTGSGKSILTEDLIMQTYDFYDYSCIIDYGLSYAALARQLGTAPIVLGPSSSVTINYFDTRGLPLTGEHLSLVALILRVMCDNQASDGMLMRYLKPYYLLFAEQWLEEHQELRQELATIACLVEKYLAERICDDEIEAWEKASAEWRNSPLQTDEVNLFMYDNREKVLFQCFARMSPEEYPTHSQFVNHLRAKPLPEEEDLKRLQEVTDSLELWRKDGKNGRLFDGYTNIEMDGKFEYYELSSVPSNDPNFKFAAGALIQMAAMRKIERMDRKKKKRLIIDEANSFFEIPQGAKVAEAALTKFRKHRCPTLISFQQYEMLNQTGVQESLISNIHQYLLMGQSDRNDVERLGEALGLSDTVKEAILAFETPANMLPENRHSAFAQVLKHKGLTAGIGRNYMTPELLMILGSN